MGRSLRRATSSAAGADAAPVRAAALVLAGRRAGVDSLAGATGISHKCLLEIAGEPMILRVIRALRADARFCTIAVSIDDAAVLERHPALAALVGSGAIALHQSRVSPSASVLDYYSRQPRGTRLLVTTADHALLTPEMVAWFWSRAVRTPADVVAGLVSGERFRARFPGRKRTLIRFREASYGGANLFALRGARAAAAAAFWVKAEKHRKRPWRLVGMFGITNLALFLARRLDLRAALERASARIGARVAVVELPFAESAIDVDKPDDLELACRVLTVRAEGSGSGGPAGGAAPPKIVVENRGDSG